MHAQGVLLRQCQADFVRKKRNPPLAQVSAGVLKNQAGRGQARLLGKDSFGLQWWRQCRIQPENFKPGCQVQTAWALLHQAGRRRPNNDSASVLGGRTQISSSDVQDAGWEVPHSTLRLANQSTSMRACPKWRHAFGCSTWSETRTERKSIP